MQRTVYYARVSTEEEHQVAALVTQCMENEEFINSKEEWMFVDKYIDEGKSGTTMEGLSEFIRLRNGFYDIRDDGSYISTTMDSMFAEWYSRNLSKKINAAQKTRMKKGTVVTNGKMWVYNQVNSNLEINEEEAEIVRFVCGGSSTSDTAQKICGG